MKYRLIYTCAAAVLALAACGTKEKAGEKTAGEAAKHEKMGEVAQVVKLKPGQWEMVSEVVLADIPNMPPEAAKMMSGQKTTISTCITPEQAAKSNADLFTARKDSQCDYQGWSMGGGKMHGAMTCENKEGGMMAKVAMKLDGSYGEDHYDLVMDMQIPSQPGGATIHMKTRVQGKRIGQCA